ncbi:MAG: ABC transporter permease [Myxococcota bacterium]|nr:ABC transporter permease [Myxococcota bacterium]
MDDLGRALWTALGLIATADPDVVAAVWASLRFSLASTVLAALFGVPLGALLATGRFRGRQSLIALSNTLLALPTVVVGLTVYAMVSRQGPAGGLGLLFTPYAVILGQTVLILPITIALSRAAVAAVPSVFADTARTLGAGPWRTTWAVVREAREGVLAACGTAFGRVIGEVGVSMMLGGNIAGYTRTMTTVIALETSKGAFELALALGIVLLVAAFGINLAVRAWGGGLR